MLSSSLLLVLPRIQHDSLKFRSAIDRLGKMSPPTSYYCKHKLAPSKRGRSEMRHRMGEIKCRAAIAKETNLSIFPTSGSYFHFSRRVALYSLAARSLPAMIPSLSEAFAFHIRTLPSSEPDRMNRASAVYVVENTLDESSQVNNWTTHITKRNETLSIT